MKTNTKRIIIILIGVFCVITGFLVAYMLEECPEEIIFSPALYRHPIDNTDFFLTSNEELNLLLQEFANNKVQKILSSNDIVLIQELGADIQFAMDITFDMIDNYFTVENQDDPSKHFADYFILFSNIQLLRVIDRDIFYQLFPLGIEYKLFFPLQSEMNNRDGKFIVEFAEPENLQYIQFKEAFASSTAFQELIDRINNTFIFERNHYITFAQGDEINAYFDETTQNISIYYEILEFIYYDLLGKKLNAVSNVEDKLLDIVSFMLIHELGHAFIDIFNLDFIGNEEDVADHLAIVLATELLGIDSIGLTDILLQFPVLNHIFYEAGGAIDFYKDIDNQEERSQVERTVYSDPHSLSDQRTFDMLALVYGANPIEASFLLSEDGYRQYQLSPEEANNAPDMFLTTSNFWYNALYPYMKKSKAHCSVCE